MALNAMTWEGLVKEIQKWPKERLIDDVTVYLVSSETFNPIIGVGEIVESEDNDEGHKFLCVDA